MKLGDRAPPWVRERRPPTRAELAAKHLADSGGTDNSGGFSGNSLGDFLEPGEKLPPVKVKRYRT